MKNVGVFVKSVQGKRMVRHFSPVAIIGRDVVLAIAVVVGYVDGSKCIYGINVYIYIFCYRFFSSFVIFSEENISKCLCSNPYFFFL